jgi:hypothetical protein
MNRSTIAVIGVILIYLLAALVEPCDGHSCSGETYEQR